jgi:hypothetical protein
MNFYAQGAAAARQLLKVADFLFGTKPGRKLVSSTVRIVTGGDGRPRVIRSLEPYYDEFVEGDPTAFDRFDDRFRDDNADQNAF